MPRRTRGDSANVLPDWVVEYPWQGGTARSTRRQWIVASATFLLSWIVPCAAQAKNVRPAERAWIERSADLARAAKQHAIAADFQREIDAHRERLRQIVLANRNPPPRLLQLHRSMILTNALLNAAAQCHSGGRLLCPPELMLELEAQLRTAFAQLASLERNAG